MAYSDEKGAAALEFALVLPILTMLAFGITEFGRALYSKEVLTNASREGARYGIILADPRPTSDEIANVVKNYLNSAGLTTTNATTATTGPPSACSNDLILTITGAGGNSGNDLSVRADYPLGLLVLPNLVTGVGSPICLTAETVMKLE